MAWDEASIYLTSEAISGIQRLIYDQPWTNDNSTSAAEKQQRAHQEFRRILQDNLPGRGTHLPTIQLPSVVEHILRSVFPGAEASNSKLPKDQGPILQITTQDLNALPWSRYDPLRCTTMSKPENTNQWHF